MIVPVDDDRALKDASLRLIEQFPGALAVLAYGGRAESHHSAHSDYDLIIVVENQTEPHRFHDRYVDLNLISLGSLGHLAQRLANNDVERPWDGMFRALTVVESLDKRVDDVVASIIADFKAPRPRDVGEINALRFLLARAIDDVGDSSDEIQLTLSVSAATGALLLAWVCLRGDRWSGGRNALRCSRRNAPALVGFIGDALRAIDSTTATAHLRSAEEFVLRAVGGSWSSGLLRIDGGWLTELPTHQLNTAEIEAVEIFCDEIGNLIT